MGNAYSVEQCASEGRGECLPRRGREGRVLAEGAQERPAELLRILLQRIGVHTSQRLEARETEKERERMGNEEWSAFFLN